MRAKFAQKQAEEERRPLVSHPAATAVDIHVGIRIRICIIDHNAGLLSLDILDLLAALRTDYTVFVDNLTAMLAELLVFCPEFSFLPIPFCFSPFLSTNQSIKRLVPLSTLKVYHTFALPSIRNIPQISTP